ncbi:MAG: DNA internalization-related competence protein ComEC/Rec2 [Candidatus Izemoplasmatales bacterium]
MKILKTILQSNASKYIHIVFILSLALYIRKQPLILMAVFVYSVVLFKKSKSLLYLSMFILFLVIIRLSLIDHRINEPIPLQAQVLKVDVDSLLVKSKYKYLVYLDDTSFYYPGMTLKINGQYRELDIKNLPNSFNYSLYLKSQGIQAVIDVESIRVLDNQKSIFYLQYALQNWIDKTYDGHIQTYLNLFILGDKSYLNQEIYSASVDIGISHLYAISGMHLGLIILMLQTILNQFYLDRKTHLLLMCFFLIIYNIITGFSISLIRASLLFILVFAFKKTSNKLSALDYLTVIFIGFLLYQPYLIYYIGFQLSFLMTFVIIVFSKLTYKKSKIKQLYILSALAYVFSLPIILSANHKIGLMNIIYNPIFIIFVMTFLLPGTFVILIYPPFKIIYTHFIQTYEKAILFGQSYNLYIDYSFFNGMMIPLYWLLLVVSISVLYKGKKFKLLAFLWLFFIILNSSANSISMISRVSILDVNQGDAIFIESNHCKAIIDTGNVDDYNSLINYIKGRNINQIDILFISHPHQDHYGEVKDLVNEIHVNRIYVSRYINTIDKESQIIAKKGDQIICKKQVFSIIHSNIDDNNENNNSLVIYTKIHNDGWLFTGDIESKVEAMIIKEFQMDIKHLKLAHHGSDTSSTDAFLNAYKPKYAYVSVGRNDYGMPSKNVLSRLNAHQVRLYSTYEIGSIEVNYIGKFTFTTTYIDGKKTYRFNK